MANRQACWHHSFLRVLSGRCPASRAPAPCHTVPTAQEAVAVPGYGHGATALAHTVTLSHQRPSPLLSVTCCTPVAMRNQHKQQSLLPTAPGPPRTLGIPQLLSEWPWYLPTGALRDSHARR